MSPDVVHKTEFKAVRVGIKDLDELIDVRDRMMQEPQLASVRLDGFLVEEMVDATWELVLGGKIDESFGPVLMVGIGGIFLEVLDDVAFRVCPVDRADVEDMLNQLRARRLLDGYRGMPSVDVAAIVDAAVALGGADGLLWALADSVLEVDINPLMVGPDGAAAADVRIVGRTAALDAMEMAG